MIAPVAMYCGCACGPSKCSAVIIVEVSGIVYLRLLGELQIAGIKADGRTRTDDLLITNQLLYQLSYASEAVYLPAG